MSLRTKSATASILISAAVASCNTLYTGCTGTGQTVVLSGHVRQQEVFGPPNFGDTPELDSKRMISILLLDHPITICQGTQDEIDTSPIASVTEVQLVNLEPSLEYQRVSLSGTLERRQNAYHYTPVFFVVSGIRAN